MQTYADKDAYMNLTYEQSSNPSSVRDCLLNIQVKAFTAKIVQSSNPQVIIIDSEIAEATENALQLQADLILARRAFDLPIAS